MEEPEKDELIFPILKMSAEKRYGEERAKELESSLEALSGSLAHVENFSVEMEEEPAFFG